MTFLEFQHFGSLLDLQGQWTFQAVQYTFFLKQLGLKIKKCYATFEAEENL